MRVTLSAVNAELAKRGIASMLVKAGDYFYFRGGEAADWLDRTVRVDKIGSLTLPQWIEQYRSLKKKNENILRPATRATSRKAAGRGRRLAAR